MFSFLQTLFRRCVCRRVRIRRLTVRANSFRLPPQQLSLFDVPEEKQSQEIFRAQRLALALDRIRLRFGMNVIAWGRSCSAALPHRTP